MDLAEPEGVMPRYFFHFRSGKLLEHDQDGLEMPDLDTAYLEAFEAAKDMWIDAIRTRGDNPSQQQFEISDADDHTLLIVPLREVLENLKATPKQLPMENAERAAKLSAEVKQMVATARRSVEQSRELLARLPV
jgi:DNA anti-recombination protein RmuC